MYLNFYLVYIGCFNHGKHSHIKTNFVHKLYHVPDNESMLIDNYKKYCLMHDL